MLARERNARVAHVDRADHETRFDHRPAVKALAIGALAIGRLAIGRARVRRLEIHELVVRRLRVVEQLQSPPDQDSECPP